MTPSPNGPHAPSHCREIRHLSAEQKPQLGLISCFVFVCISQLVPLDNILGFTQTAPATPRAPRPVTVPSLPDLSHLRDAIDDYKRLRVPWVMIAYSPSSRPLALSLFQSLTDLGVPCWLDVIDGQFTNPKVAMAEGLVGAQAVCFCVSGPGDSGFENRILELQSSGIPVVGVVPNGALAPPGPCVWVEEAGEDHLDLIIAAAGVQPFQSTTNKGHRGRKITRRLSVHEGALESPGVELDPPAHDEPDTSMFHINFLNFDDSPEEPQHGASDHGSEARGVGEGDAEGGQEGEWAMDDLVESSIVEPGALREQLTVDMVLREIGVEPAEERERMATELARAGFHTPDDLFILEGGDLRDMVGVPKETGLRLWNWVMHRVAEVV